MSVSQKKKNCDKSQFFFTVETKSKISKLWAIRLK